jgi:NADH-quinone oxidoreductase subunit M
VNLSTNLALNLSTNPALNLSTNLVGAWALVALVALPAVTALVLLAVPRIGQRAAAEIGTAVGAASLVLALAGGVTAAPFAVSGPGLQLDVPWVPALGVRLHLGLDGLSTPLVVLTALLSLLVCRHLVRIRPTAGRIRGLVACVLAVQAGATATFEALDAVVFFIAFESVLVPMWFVIARWGDDTTQARHVPPAAPRPGGEQARREAANRFVLYTVLGSAVMLLGVLLLVLRTHTADLVALGYQGGSAMSPHLQTVIAGLLVLGLAVKTPMYPLHTWLPPAHTIAPTGGSVLLAGVLLKMGSYGLLRLVVPVVPDGLRALAPVLAGFGVVGIVVAGLACFVETDLKRLIALSSVAHMGFVLLGVASMTPAGLAGAMFVNVAHGLVTALLFFVVGAVKDRHHTSDLAALGSGLRDRLPRLGWLLAFGAIAGLGLPGLAGFWGELLAIVGAWDSAALGWAARPLAVAAALGTVVAAVYLLRVLRTLWHGPADAGSSELDVVEGSSTADSSMGGPIMSGPIMGDVARHEVAVMAPLVVAVVALGLMPWLLLDVVTPAVRLLLPAGLL